MLEFPMISSTLAIALILNTFLLIIALISPKKLLTVSGYLHAWLLGVIVLSTLEWRGYTVVMFYFLVGSAVTRIGMAQKEAEGIAEKREGKRGPENVWGSALTGAVCGLGLLFLPSIYHPLFILGYVASFATKLADTTASEVGKAYGKRTFLITSLQPVPRGTEGAISLEGTIAGIVGAVTISLLGWGLGLISILGVIYCVLAAFIATNLESLIGATLQSKWSWLTNEVVNFINTLLGAIIAMGLQFIF